MVERFSGPSVFTSRLSSRVSLLHWAQELCAAWGGAVRKSEVHSVSGAIAKSAHGQVAGEPVGKRASPVRKEASEKLAHPTYAGLFECIGAKCEDVCCGNWDIPLDKITYQRYRLFPHEKLGSLVSHFVSRNPESTHDNTYAYIHPTASGDCPFFGEDRLCGVQKQYGPSLLSATCSLYPRSLSQVNGRLEGTLSLSCPEAVRLVLLSPSLSLLESNLHSGEFRTDNVFSLACDMGNHRKPPVHFLAVRSLLIELIRDRSRPIWQNLLMVASFCKRLDEATTGLKVEPVPALLDQYRVALGQGPYDELEGLPRDLKRRIELVIILSSEQSSKRSSGQRFRDAFWDFVEGIGSAHSSAADEDMDRFRIAEMDYLRPLLDAHPFLAENYLVNHMLQHLFPYGRAGSPGFIARSASDECLLLAIQFFWVSSLLIGIAGRYRETFSAEHVISTVQSFTRAVEHIPQIHEDALAAVRQRGLDDLSGISILLRT
jgi:lysine-N-methylase